MVCLSKWPKTDIDGYLGMLAQGMLDLHAASRFHLRAEGKTHPLGNQREKAWIREGRVKSLQASVENWRPRRRLHRSTAFWLTLYHDEVLPQRLSSHSWGSNGRYLEFYASDRTSLRKKFRHQNVTMLLPNEICRSGPRLGRGRTKAV